MNIQLPSPFLSFKKTFFPSQSPKACSDHSLERKAKPLEELPLLESGLLRSHEFFAKPEVTNNSLPIPSAAEAGAALALGRESIWMNPAVKIAVGMLFFLVLTACLNACTPPVVQIYVGGVDIVEEGPGPSDKFDPEANLHENSSEDCVSNASFSALYRNYPCENLKKTPRAGETFISRTQAEKANTADPGDNSTKAFLINYGTVGSDLQGDSEELFFSQPSVRFCPPLERILTSSITGDLLNIRTSTTMEDGLGIGLLNLIYRENTVTMTCIDSNQAQPIRVDMKKHTTDPGCVNNLKFPVPLPKNGSLECSAQYTDPAHNPLPNSGPPLIFTKIVVVDGCISEKFQARFDPASSHEPPSRPTDSSGFLHYRRRWCFEMDRVSLGRLRRYYDQDSIFKIRDFSWCQEEKPDADCKKITTDSATVSHEFSWIGLTRCDAIPVNSGVFRPEACTEGRIDVNPSFDYGAAATNNAPRAFCLEEGIKVANCPKNPQTQQPECRWTLDRSARVFLEVTDCANN